MEEKGKKNNNGLGLDIARDYKRKDKNLTSIVKTYLITKTIILIVLIGAACYMVNTYDLDFSSTTVDAGETGTANYLENNSGEVNY